MKKIVLTAIVFFIILQTHAQQDTENGSWLVIMSGHKTKQEAIIAQKESKISSILLYSSDYENLNPGWYILTLLFDNKQNALNKSKELNANGEKSYVKFSGLKKIVDNSLDNNVKFILNNKFIVLKPFKLSLNYKDRSHRLINSGSTIDLISTVNHNELEDLKILRNNESFQLINETGEIIKAVDIRNIYILSRIQIESYRPPWRHLVEEGNPTDSIIMEYIWDSNSKSRNQFIVAEVEYTDAILAIKNERFKPRIYESVFSENTIKSEHFKRLKNNSDQVQIYSYKHDTVCVFYYPFEDEICGNEFRNYYLKAWKVDSPVNISVPYEIPDIKIDLIIKFENINKSYIFKQNRNQSILLDLDGENDKKLPFSFIDPWEC